MQFKENILALKKYWQIIYASLLIVLIPLTIIVNTVWVTGEFKSNIDVQLQRQALSMGEVFNGALQDALDHPEELQDELERVAALNPDIVLADILVPEGDQFKVVASLTEESIGKTSGELVYVISWHQKQAIANLTNAAYLTRDNPLATRKFEDLQERFWSVSIPLVDLEGNKRALLSLNMSLAIVDELVSRTLIRSYIILTFAVIVIVLLLMANTRLFQYAALAKKLKEVEKLKDEFISMASHELRTPITSLRGYLSMLKEGALGELSDLAKARVNMMMGSADRLNELVEDLLNVSRIEQGRLTMNYEVVQVEPVIEEVMNELQVQADEKKLAFAYNRPASPMPALLVDANRLKQVLVNIIGNAIKYTPKGSVTVTSTFREEDNLVEIKCADTGLGMTQKQRERLFTKFYRVKTQETEQIKGTGLGLWITKQIVEIMGGEILVDSIKDVGTQMSVNLPVRSEKQIKETLKKQTSIVKKEAVKLSESQKLPEPDPDDEEEMA